MARFFDLQVTRHQDFVTQSDNNRLHVRSVSPTRGLIYDRNNNEVFREWKRPTKKITVLDMPFDYDKVIIDPEQYMPDIDRSNNTT